MMTLIETLPEVFKLAETIFLKSLVLEGLNT